jgi:hypothetical protein
MSAMEHSLTARYTARSVARFPRASAGNRRPRLGLTAAGAFHPATTRMTVLRTQTSAVARLRRDPRSIAATRPVRPSSGRPRPVVSPTWPRSLAPRPSAAAAPWRA